MTGKEWDNFKLSDKKEYILKNNREFLTLYNQKIKEGFNFWLSLEDLQKLINEIVAFFEFKYHNYLLEDIIYNYHQKESFYNSSLIAKKLDINELKYRLNNAYQYFLDPIYCQGIIISKKSKNMWETKDIYIHNDQLGNIEKSSLKSLEKANFIKNTNNIKTVEDLLSKLKKSDNDIDYHNLENLVYDHNTIIELRNKILNLIPLALIYSGGPKSGYIRAKSFIRMFNKEYGLNLDTTKIDEIVKKDYSTSVIEEPSIQTVEQPKIKSRKRLTFFKR